MRKRAVSLALCLCMVLSLLPPPVLAAGKHPFTDVAETVWFNDSVAYVYEHNLMKGTSDTTFEPYKATQRGMIVTILHRLEGTPTVPPENPFADVPKGSNYENAIIWAANNGIVNGYDNATFGPYENITRQQMAAILYRYAQKKGYRTSTSANLSEYADSTQIGDYARTAMAWANGEGLINGNSSKQLMPTGSATRAQVAAILTRFCQNVIPVVPIGSDDDGNTPEDIGATELPPVESVSYTVTFDLNYSGGGVYQTLSVREGEKIIAPTKPNRTSYSFLGWYTAATGGKKFDFSTLIKTNVTLYARWNRTSNTSSSSGSSGSTGGNSNTVYYTVAFNANGGSSVSAQTITNGNTVSRPTNPIREGYTFAGWYSDSSLTTEYNFASPVVSHMTLYAKWDAVGSTYTVNFNTGIGGTSIASQTVRGGEYATEPDDPTRDGYAFIGWYVDEGYAPVFDFSQAINSDLTLFAKWYDTQDTKDSDNDGLSDALEMEMGSDPASADSDNDGLSDYFELNWLNYNPLLEDTDGNGTLDKDEDPDQDGLTNAEEMEIGTNPTFADSDFDGLSDGEEVKDYGTSPLNADTDGDGVNDRIEIDIGTNPLIAESSFVTEAQCGEIAENNSVKASAVIQSGADAAGSLQITEITYSDNSLISESIPGYLGAAYDFTVSGSFDSATISFEYDDSLGSISETFQPRIYYFEEESGTLEELPDQTVADGKVSASVSHFSTYILLNKADFDKVWDTEIRTPSDTNDTMTSLDVVFVIDSSGSMKSNDGAELRKTAARNFVDKLTENDRAAVVSFANSAIVLQDFTNDHDLLYDAINRVGASGGTSLSAGISSAINLYTNSSYSKEDAYKYVIFLTDGDGNYSNTYTTQASSNSIIIYTIGLGSGVRESTLREIANGTNGKYFFASSAEQLPDIYADVSFETIDYSADSNHDGISDYYTALINDGILLLSNGTSWLVGVTDMFGEEEDDWDGDGLKNGEEIEVRIRNGLPYLYEISNPLMRDTDSDGYDDYTEVKVMQTSPMRYTKPHGSDLSNLMNDSQYVYVEAARSDGWTDNIERYVFDWKKTDESKSLLIDFFYKYASESSINANADEIANIAMREKAVEIIGAISDVIKIAKTTTDAMVEATHDTATVTVVEDLRKQAITGKREAVVSLNKDSSETTVKLASSCLKVVKSKFGLVENVVQDIAGSGSGLDTVSSIVGLLNSTFSLVKKVDESFQLPLGRTLTSFSNHYKVFMDNKHLGISTGTYISVGMDVAEGAIDIADICNTYGKIKANSEAFNEYVAILEHIHQNAIRDYTRNAAGDVAKIVLDTSWEEYNKQLAWAIGKTVGLTFLKGALSIAGKMCPYVALGEAIWGAVKATITVLGNTKVAKSIIRAEVMYGVSNGCIALLRPMVIIQNDYYSYKTEDAGEVGKYLIQLAQSRIVGEDYMRQMQKDSSVAHWTSRLITGTTKAEIEAMFVMLIGAIYDKAQALNLVLSHELPMYADNYSSFSNGGGNGAGGGGGGAR